MILQGIRDEIGCRSVHQTSHMFFQPDELCCRLKNWGNKKILIMKMLTERQHLIIQNVKINMLVHVRGHCTAHLGDRCEYDEACAFSDDHTACVSGKCDCADGFRAAQHLKGQSLCLPGSTVTFLENNYLMTTVSAVAGLVIFTALLCLVLRLFSKARFSRPADRMASAGSPPTMMSAFTGSHVLDSRRASRSSMSSTDYMPVSRRASYSMLAPPSSLGSRRASSTSVRSGLSYRTNSSFRGYRYREPVRRALSSPADSSQNFPPPSPCKVPNHQPHHHHHHSHHPIHHNSPVDEDDMLDDSPVPTVNVNHLSNHI
ncbi:hypothetical protein AVEN_230454-1 [Araneus ventricosus]|uniref:EB domain-containing protein n=1 Tax=Araneus ventricosus TaxID=182803 RepID=A0A4Y2KP92_ARAVE|nr:hypothetical protein AVEN_230454-1 [Araneus ventricosus]